MKKWTEITIITLLVISIALNIANLVMKQSGGSSSTTPEKNIEATIAWREYTREIGRKHLQIIEDRVSTSSYNSKSVVGKIVNNSNKTVEDIQLGFVFYRDNNIIGYATDYLEKLNAGTSIDFDVYIYENLENFDRYEIDYISGAIYE